MRAMSWMMRATCIAVLGIIFAGGPSVQAFCQWCRAADPPLGQVCEFVSVGA